ncbi:MAG TPA: RNA polymerase subunit sigma-24, partial [bacterium]|nr:RNA polymerase subunit sigma-24 [bacterium]
IVLLAEQDRGKWDRQLIRQGMGYLVKAATGEELSEYHLEAAIAYEHCRAPRYEDTDWGRIRLFYDLLLGLKPSPVVALHRAVAVAQELGPAAGLRALESIEGLESHYLFYAVRGDLLAGCGEAEAARDAYLEARLLTSSAAEKALLDGKIGRVVGN